MHRSHSLRTRRLALGVAAIGIGSAMLLTPTGAGASGESRIDVEFTASGIGGDCVPASTALLTRTLMAYPDNTADAFVLRIHVAKPLCDPIDATAAVYKMPGGGEAWPQTLLETKAVRLQAAGDTVVTFAKGCDPTQFDVVTGATPPVISPTGDKHGPLLFPTDTGTSLQFPGGTGCVTSTTAPTTIPNVVLPSTTLASSTGSSTTSPSTTPTTVQAPLLTTPVTPGTSDGPGVSDEEVQDLATTGANSGPLTMIGLGLVLMGTAFVISIRRPATR
ncbi:MAG: hypothetical protein R2698_12610 [Microthrixaceae bacterium]